MAAATSASHLVQVSNAGVVAGNGAPRGPGIAASGHVVTLRPRLNSFGGGRSPLRVSKTPDFAARPRRASCPCTFAARSDASAGSEYENTARGNDSATSLGPLKPESPAGQLLTTLLQSHPHLFATAADQQLDTLAADRAASQELTSTSGSDLILYKRMAEVRESERMRAVEEVMYTLIIQRFMDASVPLLPKLPVTEALASPFDTARPVEVPTKDKELEAVHSPEAVEMVREHLDMVLGGHKSNPVVDATTVAQISKLRIGQVYAASIMYGYFLRRVDQRFQLEKNMRALMGGDDAVDAEMPNAPKSQHPEVPEEDDSMSTGSQLAAAASAAAAAMAAGRPNARMGSMSPGAGGQELKQTKLRKYVLSFDQDTLQRSATMRTKQSIQVIEKHVEALFGKPEIVMMEGGMAMVKNDDSVRITLGGLRRVVLEAIAFGSFLWDVESHVDARFGLTTQ